MGVGTLFAVGSTYGILVMWRRREKDALPTVEHHIVEEQPRLLINETDGVREVPPRKSSALGKAMWDSGR